MLLINSIKKFYLKKKLKKINPKDISLFSFDGIKTYAKISKIYDGDTCRLTFYYNGKPIKMKCRIFGIDTPEIRTKNEEEKKLAYKARDFLINIVREHDDIMKVKLMHFDKYGRLLAKIYTKNKKTVSQILIENKLGYEYYGGTKK